MSHNAFTAWSTNPRAYFVFGFVVLGWRGRSRSGDAGGVDGGERGVEEVDGIEAYGCHRTLVRVAGGARWAREWIEECIDRRQN
jgi:hypothetical protein